MNDTPAYRIERVMARPNGSRLVTVRRADARRFSFAIPAALASEAGIVAVLDHAVTMMPTAHLTRETY